MDWSVREEILRRVRNYEEREDKRRLTYELNKKRAMHNIREGFRACQWKKFWALSKRHEVKKMKEEGLAPLPYVPERTKQARKMAEDGVAAVIMVGGIRSPACFLDVHEFENGRRAFPITCPCCDHIGYHDHIYWECDEVVKTLGKRPTPHDAMQK
jgi:hypothetical protein